MYNVYRCHNKGFIGTCDAAVTSDVSKRGRERSKRGRRMKKWKEKVREENSERSCGGLGNSETAVCASMAKRHISRR